MPLIFLTKQVPQDWHLLCNEEKILFVEENIAQDFEAVPSQSIVEAIEQHREYANAFLNTNV